MTAWWEGLQARERAWIAGGLLALLTALAWAYVWQPVVETRDRERVRVAEQLALIEWLDAVTPVAVELRRTATPATAMEGRSLLGLVDETARAGGLAEALQRIEPAGDGQVRVWFGEADFAAVMSWLERLAAAHPVTVEQLNAERAAQAGRVNVRITLAHFGSTSG